MASLLDLGDHRADRRLRLGGRPGLVLGRLPQAPRTFHRAETRRGHASRTPAAASRRGCRCSCSRSERSVFASAASAAVPLVAFSGGSAARSVVDGSVARHKSVVAQSRRRQQRRMAMFLGVEKRRLGRQYTALAGNSNPLPMRRGRASLMILPGRPDANWARTRASCRFGRGRMGKSSGGGVASG